MSTVPDEGPRKLALRLGHRGIADPRVLEAIARVVRAEFVPPQVLAHAYEDRPLAIGAGQTISQPFVVALMCEAASPGPADRVLEIGTGSGYGAAVLGELASEVHTVERLPELAAVARARLQRLGHTRVLVHEGDGSLGWPAAAPYQAIVVTAGGPMVPPALVKQLAPGGRLVIPVGDDPSRQRLVRVTRLPGGELRTDDLGAVQFVPLIGSEAWDGVAFR